MCPLFSFFNKIHYRDKLNTYVYHFCCVQEPYLVGVDLNGSFCTGEHEVHCGCLNQACMPVKTGHSVPYIPFSNKIHYREKLDTYINIFCNVQGPYLARLCLSRSFFAPVRMAHMSGA